MSKKSPPSPVLNNVDGKGTYGLLHPEWGNRCLMCGAYKWRVDDFCCVLAIAGVVNSRIGASMQKQILPLAVAGILKTVQIQSDETQSGDTELEI